jgi:F420-dependent oxidoreductase-like protein
MPVSFGVHTGQQDLAMDDLRTLWHEMDAAGMDWISIWDHFYEAPPIDGMSPHFESIASMATLAAETDHVRIGCLVFCMLYRPPALLAKAVTTIDHISHGRLTIGLGAGWHEPEFRAYGYDFPRIGQRLDMLEEGTQIIRSMLTQDRTTYEGKHYSVVDATCQPSPVQDRVPIWIGGQGEKRTLRIAAKYADGWNAPYIAPERWGYLNTKLDEWCAVEGTDPASVERTVNLSFSLVSDKSKVAAAEDRIREQWGEGADRIIGGSLIGTPDDAADRIAEYVAVGAQGVNIALRAPWDAEALRIYVNEVVPAMRKRFN